MIEGLKIRVTSEELKKHLEDRAAYHEGRAKAKEAEIPDLEAAVQKIKEVGGAPPTMATMVGKGHYQMDDVDPAKALRDDVTNHYNKAMVFRYLATHLFTEDYNLQEADLTRLEILKRW